MRGRYAPAVEHALVIGGTGMLRGVSLGLAEHSTVSVVARSHARLSGLVSDAARLARVINPLPVDYHDQQSLALAVRSASTAHGPISLAVCWVHSTAPGALPLIHDLIGSDRHPPRVFEVVGSAAADPAVRSAAEEPSDGRTRPRRIVLGFVTEAGGSRWLTHAEICSGILDAIANDRAATTVGVVHPWDQRP